VPHVSRLTGSFVLSSYFISAQSVLKPVGFLSGLVFAFALKHLILTFSSSAPNPGEEIHGIFFLLIISYIIPDKSKEKGKLNVRTAVQG
jgi:hypothetical protein